MERVFVVVKRLTALLIALLLYEKLASWAQIRGPTRNGCPEENSYENTDSTLPLHYVRYMFGPRNKTNTTFSFLDYLSIMSAVHRLKPSSITVHGNIEPTGDYWEQLKSRGLVKHAWRTIPKSVGKEKPNFNEHFADISKLDVLLEYGGVVTDFDVFFIRGERIKEILKTKRSIICYGDEFGNNIGFIVAKRDSKLLFAWRRSYEDIYVKDWNFNQAHVSRYLSVLYREENYLADKVCNYPHPHFLSPFFQDYGRLKWQNSIAIHTYERHSRPPRINSTDDFHGNLTSYKEMLIAIHENRPLPPLDPGYNDKRDPFVDG